MAPLLPEHKTNFPLGTHRKRVDNRAAMDAIFFRPQDGLPLKRPERHGDMLIKFRTPTPSEMVRFRSLRALLAEWFACLPASGRH